MMIQELRIGNYIQLYRHAEDSYKSIHKIKGFFFEDTLNDYAVELEDGFIVGVKGFRDIPLTEDILLKCAKFYEEDSMGSKWFGLNIDGEHYGVIELLSDGRVLYDGGFIQYLHEFQNAFYYGKNRKIELNVEL